MSSHVNGFFAILLRSFCSAFHAVCSVSMARPPATLVQQFLFVYLYFWHVFSNFSHFLIFFMCVCFFWPVLSKYVICVIDVMEILISQLAYKYVTVYLYMTVVTAWYSLLV